VVRRPMGEHGAQPLRSERRLFLAQVHESRPQAAISE